MNPSRLFRAPAPVAKKIDRLFRLLVKEKEDFEQVAGHITDHALRCTVLSLAQQNNQYAAELSSYLQCTGATGVKPAKKAPAQTGTDRVFSNEKGVLAFCRNNEKKIATAYRKVVQEAALYDGLKEIIGYQQKGIAAACMQLQLLNSLTKRHHSKSPAAMA